jgi:LmbE family N-acetylglucosaminyl deacetylase
MRANRRFLRAAGIAGGMLLLIWMAAAQSPHAITLEPEDHAYALPVDRGSAALWQTLQKLHTRASLMMVTAHPDDEDGGALAYYSRGQGARVALLTLNRGESGANVMSPDFFDALGLVRTQELLAAGRYYGVQQYFTTVINFGFSKTKEETEEKWTHDRVLAEVVKLVRMNRPLVLSSVFVGGVTDGHGNHAVAGQMAQEAFRAAADPNMFPEQIRAGLRPWQPLKVYARVPFARITEKGIYDYASHSWHPARIYDYVQKEWLNAPITSNVEVAGGQYDSLLGQSYVQVAREGLGFQKSQNGGTGVPPAGGLNTPYHRFGSQVPAQEKEQSFFDGIDTSLPGIADLAREGDAAFLRDGLRRINETVERALAEFSAQQPDKITPLLAAGLQATNTLVTQVRSSGLSAAAKLDIEHELAIKQVQFNQALAQSLGVSLLATVTTDAEPRGPMAMFMGTPETFQVAIPGQQFAVRVHVANQSGTPVTLEGVTLTSPEAESWTTVPAGPTRAALAGQQSFDARFRVRVPENARYTRPYFTRPDIQQPYYDLANPTYQNRPLAPYPLSAWAEFSYHGVTLRVGQVVQTVKRVTGPGQEVEPLVVGPAVSVAMIPSAGIVPLDAKSFPVTVNLHSNVKGHAQGAVRLDLPSGWRSTPASATFETVRDGEERSVSFEVTAARVEEKPYQITAVAEYGGREYKEGYRTVGYPGLRPYHLYRPASLKTTGVNVKLASGLRVGYVEGSGDEVPQALENLGVKVHFLTSEELARGDLRTCDVIVLGVRAYAVRQDLITHNGRLLEYVNQGGVAVVQYNTPEYDHNFGPYPYKMGPDPEEVTDEASKIDLLAPQNPVFQWPNRITAADFQGWVAERGSKFLETWDPRYEALLETHDAEQPPQKGGLLYARYGKGVYIYNAYAFYRQLPEGVPGAYRLFANLLSLPKNPQVGGR